MKPSLVNMVKRVWIPVVVVTAIAFCGVAVGQLRRMFGSEAVFSATGSSAEPLAPFHIKRVTYEIYGPSGTTGSVSYLDQSVQPRRVDFTGLPWSHTIETTVPAVIASVVAQGDSSAIGCRITVNGRIEDERTVDGHHAQISCLVKAA